MNGSYAAMIAILLGLIASAIPIGSIGDAHSVYNQGIVGLAGTDELERLDALSLHHGPLAEMDPASAWLIVGPRRPYEDAEIDAFKAFVRAGGRAIVADDDGTGRSLIEGLDVGIDILPQQLFSSAYVNGPRFPQLENTGVLPGPETVIAESPHIVTGPGDVVLRAHPMSWRDANNNRLPDIGEEQGPHAVARLVSVGLGDVLVVGDPDLLAHVLEERNPGLVAAWMDWLADNRTVVIDAGHHPASNPMGLAGALSGADDGPLRIALAVVVLGLLIWSVRLRLRPPARKRKPRTQEPSPAVDELPTSRQAHP